MSPVLQADSWRQGPIWPTSICGGLGFWGALLYLQDLTEGTHMAVEASDGNQAVVCKCTAGEANPQRGHRYGV